MKKRLLTALLTALLLCPVRHAAAAQTPGERRGNAPAPDNAAAEAARADLERKALGLLAEALETARELKLAENRVRAQLTAARLLWPRDAEAGREAFKAAADGVAQLGAAVDPEDQQFHNAAQALMLLRSELLQVAGQHDAKLALEFLRATRAPFAEALAAGGYTQQEQTLEVALAARVAAQDPRRALELAEESLSRGLTPGLINVVNELRGKDPAAAARLASAIVKRLRADELPNSYEASLVAQQLLHLSRPAGNAPGGGPGQVVSHVGGAPAQAGAAAALLDEPTRRELVEKILAALAGAGAPNQNGSYNLFQALEILLPEAERYAPGRAAELRRRADELERGFNPQGRLLRPYDELMQTGTVDALLEAAAKAPAEVRDQLYTHAAWKTFNEGKDPERARRILENVSNPQQRAHARRSMEAQAQRNAAEQGSYAEARQLAGRLSSADERVSALLHLAVRAHAAGDAETARQALEDARAFVEVQTRGQQQFHFRLQVADAYARIDPGAAFELVESAVARLDELLDAAVVLDGFGQEAFREGELRPHGQGGYTWHELIGRCAQTLTALAPSDFERARAVASKFRRADARAAAQLTLASNLLNRLLRVQRPRRGETPAGGGTGG